MKTGNFNGTGRQGDWELVGIYPTMEKARATLDQLKQDGVDCSISMVEGLAVIARVEDCDADAAKPSTSETGSAV